jgi:hypothetical protein
MRVKVIPLREMGRSMKRDAVAKVPKYVGDLSVEEERDHELGRPVVRARLMDVTSGVEADILPRLGDVRLLWARKETMRITGFERIGGVDYAQTWSVEVG